MAGFRAGMSATKTRKKNPEEEERERKLKNGNILYKKMFNSVFNLCSIASRTNRLNISIQW